MLVPISAGFCKQMEKVTGDVDRSNELVGFCLIIDIAIYVSFIVLDCF